MVWKIDIFLLLLLYLSFILFFLLIKFLEFYFFFFLSMNFLLDQLFGFTWAQKILFVVLHDHINNLGFNIGIIPCNLIVLLGEKLVMLAKVSYFLFIFPQFSCNDLNKYLFLPQLFFFEFNLFTLNFKHVLILFVHGDGFSQILSFMDWICLKELFYGFLD